MIEEIKKYPVKSKPLNSTELRDNRVAAPHLLLLAFGKPNLN